MGLLNSIVAGTAGNATANPAERWLRERYPQLFANGEQLPPVPENWTPPQMPSPQPVEQPVSATPPAAEPPRRRGGILGVLEDIFAPRPGSFMWGANNGGIWNARQLQEQYRAEQAQQQTERAATQQEAERRAREGEFRVVGNNVFHIRPDGTYEMITSPVQPGEEERLLELWRRTPEGPERSLLERMMPNYQYTPQVIGAQSAARTQTGVTVAQAREAARAANRPPANTGGGRRSGRGRIRTVTRLPAGAVPID